RVAGARRGAGRGRRRVAAAAAADGRLVGGAGQVAGHAEHHHGDDDAAGDPQRPPPGSRLAHLQSAGPGARMTVAVRWRPDPSIQLKSIFSPERCFLIWLATASGAVAARPSTTVRTSPATTPALAAGEPAMISATVTPVVVPDAGSEAGSLMTTPSWPGYPRWTVALDWPDRIWATRAMARSTGMAKPAESPTARNRRVAEAAVSMPITWPALLISGPPESPGSSGASIWISPASVSGWLPSRSVAVIVWFMATTLPLTVWGAPPTPPALPRATTGSPTLTPDDLPIGTVGRLGFGPSIWRTAMSSEGTVPTT